MPRPVELVLVGTNHTRAPVAVRERLAVPPAETLDVLAAIRAAAGAPEAVLLSTCNRTEVYAVEGETDAAPAIWSVLSARLGEPVLPYGYVRRDRDAVAHVYRVASGLDSMILGEAQIQGQVRDAWEMGRAQSGVVLNRLFQSALLVASRVRTETAVGRGAASVSSAAVQLAKKIFGSLTGRGAMILGAGEMAELALQCLLDEGVRVAIVANRTLASAQELAERYGATALPYEACWAQLHAVDLLICSTAAPHAVVRPTALHPRHRAAARCGPGGRRAGQRVPV
jgi:glutamyl-tRNA reductase